MVDVTPIDHVSSGLSQLPSQWDNKAVIRGILSSILIPLNTTETCGLDVRDGFNVNTAVGAQLDIIGDYFDELRAGRSDTEYRSAILASIASSNGSGTPNQLLTLFSSIANTDDTKIFEHYPFSMALLANNGNAVDITTPAYMKGATAACMEFVCLMYDQFSFGWIGAESILADAFLTVEPGNDQLVTDVPDNIIVNAQFDEEDDGTFRSVFIDESENQEEEGGWGLNYGLDYGGLTPPMSVLVECATIGNTLVTNGGFGFVVWAEMSELDPISGTTNKTEPIRQFQRSGLNAREPMTRQFFNWMMAQIDSWLNLFNERSALNAIRMSVNPKQNISIDTISNNVAYTVTIDATPNVFNSDSDATVDEITAGLKVAIDANTGTHGVTAIDNMDGTLSLEALASSLYTKTIVVDSKMTLTSDFDDRFDGTWTFVGEESFGTTPQTIYVFKRTA